MDFNQTVVANDHVLPPSPGLRAPPNHFAMSKALSSRPMSTAVKRAVTLAAFQVNLGVREKLGKKQRRTKGKMYEP